MRIEPVAQIQPDQRKCECSLCDTPLPSGMAGKLYLLSIADLNRCIPQGARGSRQSSFSICERKYFYKFCFDYGELISLGNKVISGKDRFLILLVEKVGAFFIRIMFRG